MSIIRIRFFIYPSVNEYFNILRLISN